MAINENGCYTVYLGEEIGKFTTSTQTDNGADDDNNNFVMMLVIINQLDHIMIFFVTINQKAEHTSCH
jgi:hypothetical protein